MTQIIIRTEKLTKYYGKTLGIENLNFEIKKANYLDL